MKKSVSLIIGAIVISIVICSCATASSESFVQSATIADAVYEGYANVKEMIPSKRRVVVIGVTGNDFYEAIWARDELTHLLVSAKRHVIIDRRGLGPDNAERKPTGEIEEASAKDIGYLLGAEVVVYGNISHYENQIRFLSLKAMDVRSGDIIAVTSERFTAS
jgi:curli biogenesis system outer membrane secretion channel CsgG